MLLEGKIHIWSLLGKVVLFQNDKHFADNVTQWMHGAQFLGHVTDDGTICCPGTAVKGVTIGAYDPRGTRNTKGDINDFSSWGKTVDGRRAVELTAPGTLVYSLLACNGPNMTPGGYFEFGGTSAALPHAVGCAALLIQANPSITPDELSAALINNAYRDEFTGPVPNDIWGYGKLRIYETFNGLKLVHNVPVTEEPAPFHVSRPFPNPFNASVNFSVQLPDELHTLQVKIYNILGQTVFSREIPGRGTAAFTWNGLDDSGKPVSSGLYFARFQHCDNVIIRRATYMR